MALDYQENYYVLAPIANKKQPVIYTKDINLSNWHDYYQGMLNVLKDGIELPEIQNGFVKVVFPTNEEVELAFPELFINMILWYSIISLDKTIMPQHLWYDDTFTAKDVKDFIDRFVIAPNRANVSNKLLNNIIADTITSFVDIDKFSMYFASTLNLEDSIALMRANKEYYDLMHCDLSDVPIDQVKNKGMEIVHKAIFIIKDSKKYIGYHHCLKDSFEAEEGVNIRQYKENSFNIGTKPNGQGSIYHEIVNQSYVTGGLNNYVYQFIDSGASRVAQIISKKNVGDSGGFSRILGLNNMESFLNPDPDYDCHTVNYMNITIFDTKELVRFEGRYYKLHPEGQEFVIKETDTFLIGTPIYLRSPITCRSYAEGHGICRHCYGDRYYTNRDINIGRIATESITAQYTQKRLSAKHLLETLIVAIMWNDAFYQFFDIDINAIKLSSDTIHEAWDGFNLIIDPDAVQLENDDDFLSHKFFSDDRHSLEDEGPYYNEYITEFNIQLPNGEEVTVGSEATEDCPEAKMYFSTDFANVIRDIIKKSINSNEEEDDRIFIPMGLLEDMTLFYTKIQNNDLGKNLDIFNDLINKKDVTKSYTKDRLLEKIIETVIKGGIHTQAVHLEVILANQIRDKYDRMKKPDWSVKNGEYELLTLNEALTDNPSIIITLNYQKLAKTLYAPSSFKKTASSIFDLFYMRKPKKFLNADHEIWDEQGQSVKLKGESPFLLFNESDKKERPKNTLKFIKTISPRPRTEIDD